MAQATLKRPAPPAVKETRLFINNKWVDPVEGETFETYNPATGEVIAKVAAGTRRRRRQGGQGRPPGAGVAALGATMDAADRGRLLFKLADLVEKNAEELAALESLNSRQDHHRSLGRHATASSTRCAITPAGPTRSKAAPCPCAAASCRTRCGSRSASSARSFPGTSRC